ncbi:flagellar hook-length control protein FliK [uncultured Tateyamaria sp.]|uniref:flagellar hook-length control protein FliK n=1 Tax=uncultured Tateyamaria sp. TaxID=455651 RepID=UPI002633AEA4|nr:flagellar hook-length control protein FliK [uncultured Tateyamaria sp.]
MQLVQVIDAANTTKGHAGPKNRSDAPAPDTPFEGVLNPDVQADDANKASEPAAALDRTEQSPQPDQHKPQFANEISVTQGDVEQSPLVTRSDRRAVSSEQSGLPAVTRNHTPVRPPTDSSAPASAQRTDSVLGGTDTSKKDSANRIQNTSPMSAMVEGLAIPATRSVHHTSFPIPTGQTAKAGKLWGTAHVQITASSDGRTPVAAHQTGHKHNAAAESMASNGAPKTHAVAPIVPVTEGTGFIPNAAPTAVGRFLPDTDADTMRTGQTTAPVTQAGLISGRGDGAAIPEQVATTSSLRDKTAGSILANSAHKAAPPQGADGVPAAPGPTDQIKFMVEGHTQRHQLEDGTPANSDIVPNKDRMRHADAAPSATNTAASDMPKMTQTNAMQDQTGPLGPLGTDADHAVKSDLPIWDTRPAPANSNPTTVQSHLSRAEIPPHISQAIADAFRRSPDKPIELALNPAELGRVRMVMSTQETGIVITITAERGDTLDLMRRNIDDLGKSLNDLGFSDVSFAFEQDQNASGDPDGKAPDTSHVPLIAQDTTDQSNGPASPAPLQNIALTGIDMRL